MSDTTMTRAELAKQAREANDAAPIDFTVAMPMAAIVEPPERKLMWVRKIHELVAGVERGDGQLGVFYKLGEFKAAGGARQTITNLERHAAKLPPYQLSLESVKTEDGGSELWGAVVAPLKVNP